MSGILVLCMPCSRYVGVVGFGVYHPISAVGFLVGCFGGVFLWGFQCRQNHNQNHRSPPLGPMEAVVIGAGGGNRPGITGLVAPNDRPDPGGVALGDRRSGVQISPARQEEPQVGPYFRRSAFWSVDAHVTLRVTFLVAGGPKIRFPMAAIPLKPHKITPQKSPYEITPPTLRLDIHRTCRHVPCWSNLSLPCWRPEWGPERFG